MRRSRRLRHTTTMLMTRRCAGSTLIKKINEDMDIPTKVKQTLHDHLPAIIQTIVLSG